MCCWRFEHWLNSDNLALFFNKLINLYPFSKIQTRAPSLFSFVTSTWPGADRALISINQKLPVASVRPSLSLSLVCSFSFSYHSQCRTTYSSTRCQQTHHTGALSHSKIRSNSLIPWSLHYSLSMLKAISSGARHLFVLS